MKRIAIVGAGFSGAVLARELAESGKYQCDVFDERDHIAGNCHTQRDSETGIMIHEYGPHIFNTSRDDVWEYINRWGKFGYYINRVKAVTKRGVFSLPLNLLTINQFFNKKFNPTQAKEFIESIGDKNIKEPKNFEEQALKFVGRELYENFFLDYTKKQWGVDPKELPASILKRLPIRFNYDDNYYNQKYQGIPLDGYTAIIERILSHRNIKVQLNYKFNPEEKENYDHTFWSGPLDAWFNFKLGRLNYRSLIFKKFKDSGDFQGNPVINYCEESIPFTRISEHKHFTPWETHNDTIYFKEFSKLAENNDILYYPLRLENDKDLLKQYMELAFREKAVTFIGRLGTYRYLDMHQVIGESLDLSKVCFEKSIFDWPIFSIKPI